MGQHCFKPDQSTTTDAPTSKNSKFKQNIFAKKEINLSESVHAETEGQVPVIITPQPPPKAVEKPTPEQIVEKKKILTRIEAFEKLLPMRKLKIAEWEQIVKGLEEVTPTKLVQAL